MDKKTSQSRKAINQRRYRELKKAGGGVCLIEYSGHHLDALNDLGLLAWNEHDREVIAEAISSFLDMELLAVTGNASDEDDVKQYSEQNEEGQAA